MPDKLLPPNTLVITNLSPSAVIVEVFISQKYPLDKATLPPGATWHIAMPDPGQQQQQQHRVVPQRVDVKLKRLPHGKSEDILLSWVSGAGIAMVVLADCVELRRWVQSAVMLCCRMTRRAQ